MEQRLFIRHMMKTLKNVVLENRKFEYEIYKYSSTLDLIASGLAILCEDDVSNLNFDMGFDIIRSNYKITMLCGCAYQGKNAVIIENLKTNKTIGQIIDREIEKGTYNATVEICDEIFRRNKNDNNESISEIRANMRKYRTSYEDAVKLGFTGSEQDFLASEEIPPFTMDAIPSSSDCNLFKQICDYNFESKDAPESSSYSKINHDMMDSVDIGEYAEKLSNMIDDFSVTNMLNVLSPLMDVLEKSGLIESISNVDELANLVRAAFYEYKYNAESILNFNIEIGSIDSFLRSAPMLKLILGFEDRIEELKESGEKFNVASFRITIHEILSRLKMSSYLLGHVEFELDITKERAVHLYDITPGHEKLILFSANVSEILEDEDYNIQPFIPLTGTSEKLEGELSVFTLLMTQNKLFLSKLMTASLVMGDFYDMDMIFDPLSLDDNNTYKKRDDSLFNITLIHDVQLNDDEIRRRYNQIMDGDSEDDDNK